MLLSSRERNEYTQKSETYSKLWFLLYIYSITPHLRQEGREEGERCWPSQFRSLAGRTFFKKRKKNLNTQNQKGKKKEKEINKSKPPSLLLFYCSALFLIYPLFPHSLGVSPGLEDFFWFINERKVSCRFAYLVHPAVIERLFWVKSVKSTLVTADGLRVRPAPVKSYHFETKQVSPAAFRAWMST